MLRPDRPIGVEERVAEREDERPDGEEEERGAREHGNSQRNKKNLVGLSQLGVHSLVAAG